MLEAMQAGADDYLVKPFDQRELKARLLVVRPSRPGPICGDAKWPESCGDVDECGPMCEEDVVSDVV
jgi:DNA-binding response OmpR family regulator